MFKEGDLVKFEDSGLCARGTLHCRYDKEIWVVRVFPPSCVWAGQERDCALHDCNGTLHSKNGWYVRETYLEKCSDSLTLDEIVGAY